MKAARLLGRHLRRPPAVAVGDLHLRDDRRACCRGAGLESRAACRFDAGAARFDLERDPFGEQCQRCGIQRLTGRAASDEENRREDRDDEGGLNPRSPQRGRRNDAVEVDIARPPRRIGEHRSGQRSGRAISGGDIDRADQSIVERRGVLFNEPRHVTIVGHPPQRQQPPHDGGDGQQHRRDPDGGERTGAAGGRERRGERDADDHDRRHRGADDRFERPQRAPPAADAIDQFPNRLVVLHIESQTPSPESRRTNLGLCPHPLGRSRGPSPAPLLAGAPCAPSPLCAPSAEFSVRAAITDYAVRAATSPSAASSSAISASAYCQRCCRSSCCRASTRDSETFTSFRRVTAD